MNKNKISNALAALALLLGTGVGITSCTDEVENLDPARGNHTAGQLGIVSLTSDGEVLPARGGSPSAVSTDTRATNDGGTSAATANRAIRSFGVGDVVTTRYRFIDIAANPAPAPEASMYTGSATASAAEPARAASTLAWAMADKSATNPLKPTSGTTPAETWGEARMEIGYAASPKADATLPSGTKLIAADDANNRSQMAYLEETPVADVSPDGKTSVRQYYDALAASTLSTATDLLPGKPDSGTALAPGKLYINPEKGTDQGSVTANLAHRGALMRLTAGKTTISGFVEGFDCLTDLLARATIKEGAADSETETDVYVRFSSVTLTGGDVVWQAIVPAGAVVKQFIATIGEPTRAGSTSTAQSATYYIPLPAPTTAMAANISYPLNLTLTPDVQTFVVGTAPALPGWPSEKEEEWVNTDAINVKDCNGADDLTAKLTAAYKAGKTEWTVIGTKGDKWSDGKTITADYQITIAINKALTPIPITASISLSLPTMASAAYLNCKVLTTVSLPVATTIDNNAFNGCTKLATIDLPLATAIGSNAFDGCTKLTTIDLPKATTIGRQAFANCVAFTTIDLPVATSIGLSAFQNCNVLNDVSLLAATSIGSQAFYGCAKLATIDLPVAETIADYAFQSCAALIDVSLPEAKSIDDNAFESCTALTTVSLPKATDIGGLAFYDCKALTTARLPVAKSIGTSAFQDCKALTTIDLPVAETIADYAFKGCAALTNVSLPVAKSIGTSAFQNCKALTNVSLPVAKSIGTNAFQNCSVLTTLSFGSAITVWKKDVLLDVTTSNITLTLAAEQKDFKQDGTGTTDVAVQLGAGKSFGGYTFKEIKEAQ